MVKKHPKFLIVVFIFILTLIIFNNFYQFWRKLFQYNRIISDVIDILLCHSVV